MGEWICRWKPFWIPTGDTFQKAYLEEWQLVDDGSKRDPGEDNLQTSPNTTESAKLLKFRSNDVTIKQEQPWDILSSPNLRGKQLENSGTQITSAFWEISGAPLLHQKRVCNYVHPKQHGPFPDRLKVPYTD